MTNLIERRIVVAETLLHEIRDTLKAGADAVETIGEAIGEFRSALAMSRDAFAAEVFMTPATIASTENGSRDLTIAEAIHVAEFLLSQAKSINAGEGILFAAEEVTLGDVDETDEGNLGNLAGGTDDDEATS